MARRAALAHSSTRPAASSHELDCERAPNRRREPPPLQEAPCAADAPVTFEATQAAIVLDTLSFRQIAIMYSEYRERSLYTLYMKESEARTEEGERGGAPVT